MIVTRRKDTQKTKVLTHRIADIAGGVSVKTADLGGNFLREGAVLSAPVNGVCNVVKTATVKEAVGATDTQITVKKDHNFKAGDFVTADVDGKAVTISAIDNSGRNADVLTIDSAIGAIEAGAMIAEAKSTAASGSELKYIPFAVAGSERAFGHGDTVTVDAWCIAVTKGNNLPSGVAAYLKGVINY